jgi:hypothetical protein
MGDLAYSLIHDPTVEGWAVTAAYAATTALCVAAWLRERRSPDPKKRLPQFWGALAVAMLVLTVNKQLDLHNAITAVGRRWVHWAGLYAQRRLLQATFVAIFALAAFCVALFLTWRIGRRLIRHPLACSGILVLACFILFRAASFHHVAMVHTPAVAADVARPLLELAGATLIAADVIRVLVQPGDDQVDP